MNKNSLIAAALLFLQLSLCSCGQRETGADNRMDGMENVPEQAVANMPWNVFIMDYSGYGSF